jgi:predicted dehydrogenase
MRSLSRRDFLHESAALAALAGASAVTPTFGFPEESKAAKKGGANETLRVAVVGVNGRGMSHVGAFSGNTKLNTIVTTICDCDEGVIGRAMRQVEEKQGKAPKFEKDLRRVLEDKNVDIVTIATPNHWHALAAIWAIQAGKDVYVEKPVSHNVSEGRRIVEAARKYNRICQTGTQSRSTAGMRAALDFIHSGKIGKIKIARGLCYKPRGSIGKVSGPQEPPKTCDYDLWCGPAPKSPLMRKRLHYDWHWVWATGNGDLGNQGIHEMDKARWGLNKNELPKSVVSVGGRFGYIDDGETANTQICVFDYGDCELIFEVRGLKTKDLKGAKVGNIWYGTEGYVVAPSYSSATAFTNDGQVIQKFSGGGDEGHFGNFIKAVRSRKVSDLNADILEGHLSSALCHLGNVSYRLGSEQPFSKQPKCFGDDKEAAETLERMRDHLKDNSIKLEDTKYRVGKLLSIDAKAEKFIGDKNADALLTREYRQPFVVPEKV